MSTAPTRLTLASRLVPTALRLLRVDRHHRTREDVRRRLAHLARRPASTATPRRAGRGLRTTTRREDGWPIHTVAPAQGPSRGTVLYLHGGAWTEEAAPAHWRLVRRIARETGARVEVPVYPLLAAGGTAASVVPVVARLAERAAGPLVLAGDSAGGTIALSTALLLRDHGVPADLTVLISPALDLRMENPRIDEVQPRDPWLVKTGQLEQTERWIGEHREDPVLNPFLGDVRGAGPLLVFSGTRDLLNPDTRLFVRRAEKAGASIDYREGPGLVHVHPLLPTPEGRRARDEIAAEIRRALG